MREPAAVLRGTSVSEGGLNSRPCYLQAGVNPGILGTSWGFLYTKGANGQVCGLPDDRESSPGP